MTVDELVRGVKIALQTLSLSDCPEFDTSGDRTVTVDEIVQAVGATLSGCDRS